MVSNVIWILDKKNSYPPVWESGSISSNNAFLIAFFYTIYWFYIYYKKHLNCKRSIVVGLVSCLFFLFLYYFQYQSTYAVISTTDEDYWYYYYTNTYDTLVNMDQIKKGHNIDIKKDGYAVTQEFYDKIKDKQNIVHMDEYKGVDKERLNISNEDNILHNYLDKILNFKSENILFQGYCLITLLFTLLSIIWRMNKILFRRLFQLFIQALAVSIPLIFLSYWFYNTKYNLTVSNWKTYALFLGLSITLSIITEIYCLTPKL